MASWRRASMMDDLEEPEAEALRMYDNVACGQGDTRTISMSMDEEVVWNQGTASEQQVRHAALGRLSA